ncbi:MAG: restriction endonuclease, SacI family [Ignavibacteriales bacterium]|nr:restriction endonuclease, SacI family [Ignavibacteriales bacterium]
MAKKVEYVSFSQECVDFLNLRWTEMEALRTEGGIVEPLISEHQKLKEDISACLRSSTKTYRYVLPTQVLCKCVDPNLDCRSIQKSFDSPGSFDARSIAHEVIVPFDVRNHKVLGGSTEPYVNNPLRCDSITDKNRSNQKNKVDWDRLVGVLGTVQEKDDSKFTKVIFDQILFIIYSMLDDVKVTYPVPNRISLSSTLNVMAEFLTARSGGDRLEALVTALFRVMGKAFNLYDEVRRQTVNVADVSSGMAGDIECCRQGKIVLIVEVKDRTLTLVQLDTKLATARSKKINELMFLAQGGIEISEVNAVEQRIAHEFGSGQNVYVTDIVAFAKSILILLGETGRVEYLHEVGRELDWASSPIPHRKAWASLLLQS